MSTLEKKPKKIAMDFCQLTLGIVLSSFALACFALPYDMVVSGLAGLGRVVEYYTGLKIVWTMYAINIALFLLGLFIMGKKFAATIAFGTFVYPFFLGLFQEIEGLHHLVEDPLLAATCAGILDGVGMGLVLRMGGSTGGVDVVPLILNKKRGWRVAPIIYGTEVVAFLCQLPISNTNGVILGILYALIYTFVMDRIIVMASGGVQLFIFSKKSAAILERLLSMDFGATILRGKGGYMQEPIDVIYCVAGSRYLNQIKRAVLAEDENAFLSMGSVSEINGNGFTAHFDDDDYTPELSERREGTPR